MKACRRNRGHPKSLIKNHCTTPRFALPVWTEDSAIQAALIVYQKQRCAGTMTSTSQLVEWSQFLG